jgi:hypothetical protein
MVSEANINRNKGRWSVSMREPAVPLSKEQQAFVDILTGDAWLRVQAMALAEIRPTAHKK